MIEARVAGIPIYILDVNVDRGMAYVVFKGRGQRIPLLHLAKILDPQSTEDTEDLLSRVLMGNSESVWDGKVKWVPNLGIVSSDSPSHFINVTVGDLFNGREKKRDGDTSN